MVLGWTATQQACQLSHACVLFAEAQFLRHTLELGFGLVPGTRQRNFVRACVPACDSWLAACLLACSTSVMWPALPEPGLLPEWKDMWQPRVVGSCLAGGSGYSSVALGHLALTWSGRGQQAAGWPCSHSLPSFRIQIQLQVGQSHGHSRMESQQAMKLGSVHVVSR